MPSLRFLRQLGWWTLVFALLPACGQSEDDPGGSSGGSSATGGSTTGGGSASGGGSTTGGSSSGGASSGGASSGGASGGAASGGAASGGAASGGSDSGGRSAGGSDPGGGGAPTGGGPSDGGAPGSGGSLASCDCDSVSIPVCAIDEEGNSFEGDAGCGTHCVDGTIQCRGQCPCTSTCACTVEGECDLTQDTGAQIRCDTLGGISTQTFTDLGCSVLPTGAFRVCCPEEPPLSIWCPLD